MSPRSSKRLRTPMSTHSLGFWFSRRLKWMTPPLRFPWGAENILLRGAVVRNTEWVIGLACFTGTDTKLVQNSFETPSKFSQLDILMNKTVLFVLVIMFLCISYLASMAVVSNGREFDNIW